MLDWMKTTFGDSWTDEIEASFKKELGKHFVARADFNAVNTAKQQLEDTVKSNNEQLATLAKAQGDVSELQAEIENLRANNQKAADDYAAQLRQVKCDGFVDSRLNAAGCLNVTAAKALLAEFLASAEPKEDGSVDGLDEKIADLKAAEDSAMLFPSKNSGGTGLEHGGGSEIDTAQIRRDLGLE